MKNLKNWLLAAVALFPLAALAQVVYPGSSGSVSNATIAGTANTTETLPTITDTLAGLGSSNTFTSTDTFSGVLAPTGSINTQGMAFTSSTAAKNPLTLMTVQNIPVAFISTAGTYAYVSGSTGRVIWPGVPTIMVSGTAAGATSLTVECSGGTLLGTFPIAALVNNVPVTPFSSVSTITNGKAFAQGCASGDGLVISANGAALTTTTNVYINQPYTVQ